MHFVSCKRLIVGRHDNIEIEEKKPLNMLQTSINIEYTMEFRFVWLSSNNVKTA